MTDTPGPEREIVELMAGGSEDMRERGVLLRGLARLSAAGYVVVPREPPIGYEAVAEFWSAMLAAAEGTRHE